MKKFLVVFQIDPISDAKTAQDHIVEGDEIELTEYNTLHVTKFNFQRKSGKEIVAIYNLNHIVCAVEMDK